MENIKWIFDGFGTEILSLIIGLTTGGAIGYKVGIRNKIKQNGGSGILPEIGFACQQMFIRLLGGIHPGGIPADKKIDPHTVYLAVETEFILFLTSASAIKMFRIRSDLGGQYLFTG